VDGLTLAFDASAGTGTIAVLRDGTLVGEQTLEMRSSAEERFLPAVVATLASVGASVGTVERIVCGAGPGSFTSLRVVAAAAKGLAQGTGRPLYAVPSLALTVTADARTTAPGTRWLSTLDAMRADRYLALVTIGDTGDAGAVLAVESLGLAPQAEVAARATALDATAIGPDEPLVAEPHARGVARCLALIAASGPVDLARWEPVYGRLAEAQVKWEAAQGRSLR
jgi:tRNA threonylcarbamoyladenosine biosynthesis protein TsaB